MSNPRDGWWSYAKYMIRRYPQLKEEYNDLHSMKTTVGYADEPHSSEISRTLENAAIRELPHTKQREYVAVHRAIETTMRYRNGMDRLYIINLVHWKKSHTIEGAALTLPCHAQTAKQWNREFVRMVASYYGLMD